MESKFKLPTESVELPSKGLLYPKDSPLTDGTIEMKYMTAREEDILTNQNYIRNGTVIDRLLKSLIVTEGFNYNELLIGDKNAVMLAARVLAYGKDYEITYQDKQYTVDLSKLETKKVDEKLYEKGENNFSFTLPHTDNSVTFKLLTHGDEKQIEREIEGLKRLNKEGSFDVTTRLKYMITSINGLSEKKDIREFVDNFLLAKDARELRRRYIAVQPDVEFKFIHTDEIGREEEVPLAIGLDFFWPDA
jgi:hypothetical protein|tara:strand:+ start:100 stop:843 length:744 start_codon:yes stop_codon:yes gene_type:complete